MIKRNVVKLSENVYWVGSRDWNRRVFDALIPLPKGTSYNAYLVIGDEGSVLIDTVNPGFEKELEEKVRSLIDPETIRYIVMNHAEPDHAGAIPYMMKIASKAKLITSRRGVKMAQVFYHIPGDRMKVVSDQETLSLGGRTLRFIEAPMLHWPETMFTYLQEEGILFPCDFFGSHLAGGVYDEEVEDLTVHAQRYWGEIMMPYRGMALKALEKLKGLDIMMIAPSHGPIYRNPERILQAYRRWASGETKRKATVAYVSMWGSTEKMVQQMVETLASEDIEIALYNLAVTDIGDLTKDLVDSKALVLGAPTVLSGAHPLAIYAAYFVRALQPPTKFVALLTSYGWGGGAIKQIQEILGQLKVEVIGVVEVNGPPSEDDMKKITEIGRVMAKKIKEEGSTSASCEANLSI
jgi:flavorubredoxin